MGQVTFVPIHVSKKFLTSVLPGEFSICLGFRYQKYTGPIYNKKVICPFLGVIYDNIEWQQITEDRTFCQRQVQSKSNETHI